MQIVEADRAVWRGLPRRFATITMAVIAGVFSAPAGLIAGAVFFFAFCLVRRQCEWFVGRATWGYLSIALVPILRVVYWLSLAFMIFGFWRQEVNPFLALPLIVAWWLVLLGVERTPLSLR